MSGRLPVLSQIPGPRQQRWDQSGDSAAASSRKDSRSLGLPPFRQAGQRGEGALFGARRLLGLDARLGTVREGRQRQGKFLRHCLANIDDIGVQRLEGHVLVDAPPVKLTSDVVELNRQVGLVIGDATSVALWSGERLDYAMAVDALLFGYSPPPKQAA